MARGHWVLLGLLLMAPFTMAQAEETASPTEFDLLFGLDTAIERIQLIITTNADREAQLHLAFAQERLEELRDNPSPSEQDIARAEENIKKNADAVSDLIPEVEEETLTDIEEALAQRTAILEDLRDRLPQAEGLTVALSAPQHAVEVTEQRSRAEMTVEEIDRLFPLAKQAAEQSSFVQGILARYERVDLRVKGDGGRTLAIEDGMIASIGELQEGEADVTLTVTAEQVAGIREALDAGNAQEAIKRLFQTDVEPVSEQVRIAGMVVAEAGRSAGDALSNAGN